MRALFLGLACLAGACSSFSESPENADAGPDASVPDANPVVDAGRLDASSPDAAPDAAPGALRIFVSSTAYNGNLEGISGANKKCESLGHATPLRSGKHEFIALIADMAGNLPALTPGPRVDLLGRSIFPATPTISSKPAIPVTVMEDGLETAMAFSVWTGAKSNDVAAAPTCGTWGTENASESGGVGMTTAPMYWWNVGSSLSCGTDTNHLYCIEQ